MASVKHLSIPVVSEMLLTILLRFSSCSNYKERERGCVHGGEKEKGYVGRETRSREKICGEERERVCVGERERDETERGYVEREREREREGGMWGRETRQRKKRVSVHGGERGREEGKREDEMALF